MMDPEDSVAGFTSLALEEAEQEASSSVASAHTQLADKSFRFGAMVVIVINLTLKCNTIVTYGPYGRLAGTATRRQLVARKYLAALPEPSTCGGCTSTVLYLSLQVTRVEPK